MSENFDRPSVTVYVPCHNYGRFLKQCIDSVLCQTLDSWELLIVDDGSTDNTWSIACFYSDKYPDRIRIFRNDQPQGLQKSANMAISEACGRYIMRLDSDDYLDENALLVMSSHLDRNNDVALVFPNYMYVDVNGKILGVENRKKIGCEAKVLDIPPHGACTMVRTRIIKSVGGYSENIDAQDGHELWIKVSHRYKVDNITTPLFFYRKHDSSLSRDENRLLRARHKIHRELLDKQQGQVIPRAVAVIPAKNTYPDRSNLVLTSIAGKPLIDYTLDAAKESGLFDKIIVTTDDPAVVEHCTPRSEITVFLREQSLSNEQVRLSQVLFDAVMRMEKEKITYPDIVALLSVHSPLREAEHICAAVNTLRVYDVDSVTSVYEDYDVHFHHGEYGLEPLNPGMLEKLRLEREALFVDNGAIRVIWRDAVTQDHVYGHRIGHVVMPVEKSLQIKSDFDAFLVEQVLSKRNYRNNDDAF